MFKQITTIDQVKLYINIDNISAIFPHPLGGTIYFKHPIDHMESMVLDKQQLQSLEAFMFQT